MASLNPPQPDSSSSDFTREQDRVDVKALHDPIMQEMGEPRDGYEPIPVGLILFYFSLLAWGGWYLGTYSGGWDSNVYQEMPWGGSAAGAQNQPESLDPIQLGKIVFNNCRACHQSEGQGVAGNYPPLAGSERVLGPPELMARIILNGLEGKIVVKGQPFNNVMPAWRNTLTDEQIAAVMTYIRQSWGNKASPIKPALLAAIRKETADRNRPWTDPELNAIKVPAAPKPAILPAPTAATNPKAPSPQPEGRSHAPQ